MWTLPSPSIDEARNQLTRALSRDRGEAPYALTDAEADSVLEKYQEYDNAGGAASDALAEPAVSDALSDAIHDAYSHVQDEKRLSGLRTTLKEAAALCPYCSSPAISDLDHYLPRSKYRDLAIYSRNLIPSCHPCNNVKRAYVPAEGDHPLIHPYFDRMPAQYFLVASTTISATGALEIALTVNTDILGHEELLQRAAFQLLKFDINEKSKTAINVFLSNLQSSFDLAFQAGAPGMKAFLNRTAQQHETAFGLNDWRSAVLRSLADNEAFCNGGFEGALGKITFGDGLA